MSNLEVDEKIKWLESRISSSLKPRNDDLKKMLIDDENRFSFHSFFTNEDVRKLFVYIKPNRQIVVSLQPPCGFNSKAILFLKASCGVTITKHNLDNEILFMDCSENVLEHVEILCRDVFLPLLCTDTYHAQNSGVNADKLLDGLHRLMAHVEMAEGHSAGEVILPFPAIKVLQEAASNVNRRLAVLHVLESTVILWMKQINSILKQDAMREVCAKTQVPTILDEIYYWNNKLRLLGSIQEQLRSNVGADILHNLFEANSAYASSFSTIQNEMERHADFVIENLNLLKTIERWVVEMDSCTDVDRLIKLAAPTMRTILLIWKHSPYYHNQKRFGHLMMLLCNQIVQRAKFIVGKDVLKDPVTSQTKIGSALRLCATWRGKYLDERDTAFEINAANLRERSDDSVLIPCFNDLFTTKLYGPHAYRPGFNSFMGNLNETILDNENDVKADSKWPARNADCFAVLNLFIERCNDVLELVETTRHFSLLSDATKVGGAGSKSLNALVKEIYQQFKLSTDRFYTDCRDVMDTASTDFAAIFFKLRMNVRELERKLASVLRSAFMHCPTLHGQLRLLAVFEGVYSRENVRAELKDKDLVLANCFKAELENVEKIFQKERANPPNHKNMPKTISCLLWAWSIEQRIESLMDKMKRIAIHVLKGDSGWKLRNAYNELIHQIKNYQKETFDKWQEKISKELIDRLSEPLFISENFEQEDDDVRPQIIKVNLDPELLQLLREVGYLTSAPLELQLPRHVRHLVRDIDAVQLSLIASRLNTIASKYNSSIRLIRPQTEALFEATLFKIVQILDEGLNSYTWRTIQSLDYIEKATDLVCRQLHHGLNSVENNFKSVLEITDSWLQLNLDVFNEPYSQAENIDCLISRQNEINNSIKSSISFGATRIHALLSDSFDLVQISEASPAWKSYVGYIDTILTQQLLQTCFLSIESMFHAFRNCFLEDATDPPILIVRLELIDNQIAFRPPLDASTVSFSIPETINMWIESFLKRASYVQMVCDNESTFEKFVREDEDLKTVIVEINKLVNMNCERCWKLKTDFENFSFLWQSDVHETFTAFLCGVKRPNTMREMSEQRVLSGSSSLRQAAAVQSRTSSSTSSFIESGLIGTGEQAFLTVDPSLDDFDTEIDMYREARDKIRNLSDKEWIGFMEIDMRPAKQVLLTLASKWMWIFIKYLIKQVTNMLVDLDEWLKDIEPEIEAISGEESDTNSFMRLMRLFNRVVDKQTQMEGKFAAMHRTVLLVKKYGFNLPSRTNNLFDLAPSRWANLKTKVSLAKQRLGPRIQEESAIITKDLTKFAEKLSLLKKEIENSDVFQRSVHYDDAKNILSRLFLEHKQLEDEASDLQELQLLLESNVVDFNVLMHCLDLLNDLTNIWQLNKNIDDQLLTWKKIRWTKIDTNLIGKCVEDFFTNLKDLNRQVSDWDVYIGIEEKLNNVKKCLPLVEALTNPAMRTRHWKQLVRVTGVALHIDNERLKRMTFGEILNMKLHLHADDVKAIVERAIKDLQVEQTLKNYEEIWLSKILKLKDYARNKALIAQGETKDVDSQSEVSQQERSSRQVSRMSTTGSKVRRQSVMSLPASLANIDDSVNLGAMKLITDTDSLLEELENHQLSLQTMQTSSAAGSFVDEVVKWQRRLHTIEAVLSDWLKAQQLWTELDSAFGLQDVQTALPIESANFNMASKDFRLLMKATEKNPNILQCCERKHINALLDRLLHVFEKCYKSLLKHVERLRQRFPRFYFLSLSDVFQIIANGYDVVEISKYLNKLFVNIAAVEYTNIAGENDGCLPIIGIRSKMGELLKFNKAIQTDGPYETWLKDLLKSIRKTLTTQMAMAMNNKIGDATDTIPADNKTNATEGADGEKNEIKNDETDFDLLSNCVKEIVYLSKQVEFSEKVIGIMKDIDDGKRESIDEGINWIENNIKESVSLLKTMEEEYKNELIENEEILQDASKEIKINVVNLKVSQIDKIQSLIALQTQHRNLLKRLKADENLTSSSFLWHCQFLYSYNAEPNSNVIVKAGDVELQYGYEYCGSCQRQIQTPQTEQVAFHLTRAVASQLGGFIIGNDGVGKLTCVIDLANCLGRPLYNIEAGKETNIELINNVFKGYCMSGSWIVWNKIDLLSDYVLATFNQLMDYIQQAVMEGKQTIRIDGSEVSFKAVGVCFALMDKPNYYGSTSSKINLFTSENCLVGLASGRALQPKAMQLSSQILAKFRIISIMEPDRHALMESLLITYGFQFESANLQSKKILNFIELLKKLVNNIRLNQAAYTAIAAEAGRLVDAVGEEKSIVLAIRTNLLPTINNENECLILNRLFKDIWPDIDIDVMFTGLTKTPEIKNETPTSIRNIDINTPVVLSNFGPDFIATFGQDAGTINNLEEAIALSTIGLGLIPGTAFQGKVLQLAQLAVCRRSLVVLGSSGCGKSEIIKTWALAERRMGKVVDIQSVFTQALPNKKQFMGYFENGKWKDGLLAILLRKLSKSLHGDERNSLEIIQMDGDFDDKEAESLTSILQNDIAVFSNNERIMTKSTLRFIWETDQVDKASPALLSHVGIISVSDTDVGWRLPLVDWLKIHNNETLNKLFDDYFPSILNDFEQATRPPMIGKRLSDDIIRFDMAVDLTKITIVQTFLSYMDALQNNLSNFGEQLPIEIERCIHFALIWSIGGSVKNKLEFSNWWREKFIECCDIPNRDTVFDYTLDSDTHDWINWQTLVTSYSGLNQVGIAHDAFVGTSRTARFLQLINMLGEVAKPVLLIGKHGVGKTSLVNERIRTACSGEVAELASLTVNCNELTNSAAITNRLIKILVYGHGTDSITTATVLSDRLMERLEWRHGRTYVPRANKRLMLFIDDLHMNGSTSELIRQHIDDSGFYEPNSLTWRYVKNVSYVVSMEVGQRIDPRLLRHFAVLHVEEPNIEEKQTIFTTLLNAHYVLSEAGGNNNLLDDDDSLSCTDKEQNDLIATLDRIIKVGCELQEKLINMFLPTDERCHYVWTMRNLVNIFRNLCQSTRYVDKIVDILALWRHECWQSYAGRMTNHVDIERYKDTWQTGVRKYFDNVLQLQILVFDDEHQQPIFSNILEQDSGIVMAGRPSLTNITNSRQSSDMYKPTNDLSRLRRLLKHAIDEYNKSQPRLDLKLYRISVELVCRWARLLGVKHSHMLILADGCCGRTQNLIELSAYLAGFSTTDILPSNVLYANGYDLKTFQNDLINIYIRAGVKNERLVLVVDSNELVNESMLVLLCELIVHGEISHLFDEQRVTTIVNAVRTEVTQAGLTYSHQVAWNYFLHSVQKNIRICIVLSDNNSVSKSLLAVLASHTSVTWMGHWSKRLLVQHAQMWLNDLSDYYDKKWRDNYAYLLANMHLAIRNKNTSHNNLTNLTFERFVQKFCRLTRQLLERIESEQLTELDIMQRVQAENNMAKRITKELQHEEMVLNEKKIGSIRLLTQIGQDTAITEQQVRIVKAQLDKIERLKKVLPEYQVAHERAVYKTTAIVSDTDKLVKNMSKEALAELRSLTKAPIPEVEDLLAAVIILLKSPNADLTWSRGAKRQMANLERFLDELQTFDRRPLAESTLVQVEEMLKKPALDSSTILDLTKNVACESLAKWVKYVCRYHRIIISRVRPLYSKVESTSAAVELAQQKMKSLEIKRQQLEKRLADLAKSLEESTIDKNEQKAKSDIMADKLKTAGQLENVLRNERRRIRQIVDSFEDRKRSVGGGCAMASAMACYLAPYKYEFRRQLLTIDWPICLRDRGISLLIDSIDQLKGRVIDWSMDGVECKNSESVLQSEFEENNDDNDEFNDEYGDVVKNKEDGINFNDRKFDADEDEEEGGEMLKVINKNEENDDEEEEFEFAMNLDEDESVLDDFKGNNTNRNEMKIIMLNDDDYNCYLKSLVRLLIGEKTLHEWQASDLSLSVIQNASLMLSADQQPSVVLDPFDEGLTYMNWLVKKFYKRKISIIDMSNCGDHTIVENLEKAILKGHVLIASNCPPKRLDSMLYASIAHANSRLKNDSADRPTVIKHLGRRLLARSSYRLFMTVKSVEPLLGSLASTTLPVNFEPTDQSLMDDFIVRSTARLKPELYRERRKALNEQYKIRMAMLKLVEKMRENLGKDSLKSDDVESIADLTAKKMILAERDATITKILNDLENLKENIKPLANRAVIFYKLFKSLSSINDYYRFGLPFFLRIFDASIGAELPSEFGVLEDVSDIATVSEMNLAPPPIIENKQPIDDKDADLKEEQQESSGEQHFISGESITQEEDEIGLYSEEKADVETLIESEWKAFSLPDEIDLPTNGLEYTSIDDEQIQQSIRKLTANVVNKIEQCILEKDRLAVLSMLVLLVQQDSNKNISDEEFQMFFQGNPGLDVQLSLKDDFNCDSSIPDFIPICRWQDILALSVLQEDPLNSLCAKMAINSKEWKDWYNGVLAENNFPIELNELRQLLLLRFLRADRLPTALRNYVLENLEDVSDLGSLDLAPAITSIDLGLYGNLIPISSNDDLSITDIAASLSKLGSLLGVELRSINIIGSNHQEVIDALELAEKENVFLIVNDLHLADCNFISKVRTCIHRLMKDRQALSEEKKKDSNFCVWFTSNVEHELPIEFVSNVLLFSSDSLSKFNPSTEHTDSKINWLQTNSFSNELLNLLLKIDDDVAWNIIRENSKLKSIAFGICVLHTILVCRQKIGNRLSARRYPLNIGLFKQSLNSLNGIGEDDLNAILKRVVDGIYGNFVYDEKRFLNEMGSIIFRQIVGQDALELKIGKIDLPLPKENFDPSDWYSWLKEVINDIDICDILCLNDDILKTANDFEGRRLIGKLKAIYDCQELDNDFRQLPNTTDLLKLRICLDSIDRRLPQLIELDNMGHHLATEQFNFPYHRQSVVSIFSGRSTPNDGDKLPHSLAFVLLNECLTFNRTNLKIRHDLYCIDKCLAADLRYIDKRLTKIVEQLLDGLMPIEWLNDFTTTHLLDSWLTKNSESHKQLHEFRAAGIINQNYDFALKKLTNISLGLLNDIVAFVTALRLEKAVLEKCIIDDIRLFIVDQLKDDDVGIEIDDFYVQGSMFNGLLIDSDIDTNHLTGTYLKADFKLENKTDITSLYVYNDETRQTIAFEICIKVDDYNRIVLNSTALVLDKGMPIDQCPYSKQVITQIGHQQPAKSSARQWKPHGNYRINKTIFEESEIEEEGEENELESDEATLRSSEQTKSQLSYKPMTPKGPPLPPDLQIGRSKALEITESRKSSDLKPWPKESVKPSESDNDSKKSVSVKSDVLASKSSLSSTKSRHESAAKDDVKVDDKISLRSESKSISIDKSISSKHSSSLNSGHSRKSSVKLKDDKVQDNINKSPSRQSTASTHKSSNSMKVDDNTDVHSTKEASIKQFDEDKGVGIDGNKPSIKQFNEDKDVRIDGNKPIINQVVDPSKQNAVIQQDDSDSSSYETDTDSASDNQPPNKEIKGTESESEYESVESSSEEDQGDQAENSSIKKIDEDKGVSNKSNIDEQLLIKNTETDEQQKRDEVNNIDRISKTPTKQSENVDDKMEIKSSDSNVSLEKISQKENPNQIDNKLDINDDDQSLTILNTDKERLDGTQKIDSENDLNSKNRITPSQSTNDKTLDADDESALMNKTA